MVDTGYVCIKDCIFTIFGLYMYLFPEVVNPLSMNKCSYALCSYTWMVDYKTGQNFICLNLDFIYGRYIFIMDCIVTIFGFACIFSLKFITLST